ncbi:MAG TPA: DUF2721 domain-containing protein [Chlamydiales bacterium]|nr:DUF2721 domain-containing protein [Chlamydiales bacterium]
MASIPNWSQVISLAVAPVVIISACGLLCLTFYNRLAFVVGRLRNLQRERLLEYKELFKLEKSSEKARSINHLLKGLKEQTAQVMKRAALLRKCLFFQLGTIGSLVLCCLTIGFNLYYPFFEFAVLFFFGSGLLLLLCSLMFAFIELGRSLFPVKLESDFIEDLTKETRQELL